MPQAHIHRRFIVRRNQTQAEQDKRDDHID